MIFLLSIINQLPIVVMVTLWWFLCFVKNYNGSKSQLFPIFKNKIILYGTYAYVQYMYFHKIQKFLSDMTEIFIGTNISVTVQDSIYLYWYVQLKRALHTSITYIKVAFQAAACWAVCTWNKLYQCLKRVWNDWLTILKVFLKSSRRSRKPRAIYHHILRCGWVIIVLHIAEDIASSQPWRIHKVKMLLLSILLNWIKYF